MNSFSWKRRNKSSKGPEKQWDEEDATSNISVFHPYKKSRTEGVVKGILVHYEVIREREREESEKDYMQKECLMTCLGCCRARSGRRGKGSGEKKEMEMSVMIHIQAATGR